MSVFVVPSATNTYLPGGGAEEQTQMISFLRNPASFKFNEYVKFIPSDKFLGKYIRINPNAGSRVVDSGRTLWRPGADRPMQPENQPKHDMVPFMLESHNLGTPLAYATMNQSPWDLASNLLRVLMQQRLTGFTIELIDALRANGVLGTATSHALVGGNFAGSTTTDRRIKRAFHRVVLGIHKRTRGATGQRNILAIMNPDTAQQLSRSQEIDQALNGSMYVAETLREGSLPPVRNALYNVPDRYAGVDIVVEDALYDPPDAPDDAAEGIYAMPDNEIIFVTKIDQGVDEQVGENPTINFSTIQNFFGSVDGSPAPQQYELAIKVFDEPKHNRVDYNIETNWHTEVVAPSTGYRITGCFNSTS